MALEARAPRASVSRGVVEVLERSGPGQQLGVRLWRKSASENRCFVGIAILSCLIQRFIATKPSFMTCLMMYSGTPLMRTLLGPRSGVLIREVSYFRG